LMKMVKETRNLTDNMTEFLATCLLVGE